MTSKNQQHKEQKKENQHKKNRQELAQENKRTSARGQQASFGTKKTSKHQNKNHKQEFA